MRPALQRDNIRLTRWLQTRSQRYLDRLEDRELAGAILRTPHIHLEKATDPDSLRRIVRARAWTPEQTQRVSEALNRVIEKWRQ